MLILPELFCQTILPVLKYVRGEIFSDQHWTEMYQILGMPKKTVDKLVFDDFLQVKVRHPMNQPDS